MPLSVMSHYPAFLDRAVRHLDQQDFWGLEKCGHQTHLQEGQEKGLAELQLSPLTLGM